jgi:hypothetical protein
MIADPFDASDICSGSTAQLTFDVHVVLDWRFRLGLLLARCGFALMGFDATEIRFLPTPDPDGHRPP